MSHSTEYANTNMPTAPIIVFFSPLLLVIVIIIDHESEFTLFGCLGAALHNRRPIPSPSQKKSDRQIQRLCDNHVTSLCSSCTDQFYVMNLIISPQKIVNRRTSR